MDLSKFDTKTLARWYSTFNRWEWPNDFVVPKPEDWEQLKNYYRSENRDEIQTKSNISRPYMNVILSIIGRKEHLRYHHINNLGVSNFQFEVWWIVEKFNNLMSRFLKDFYFDIYTLFRWRKNGTF